MRFNKYQICLVILILFSGITHAQSKRLFDFNEGLSNSLINKLCQDHLGFIWIATEDGLNRFDGIKFVSFSQDKKNRNSLKSNFITSVIEDSKNNLWVGQINGLQTYNHSTESFTEMKLFVSNKQIHPYVSSIIESSTGDIWITTSGFGLMKIDKNTGRPRYSTTLNKRLCSLYLQSIYEDRDGFLWIGSDNEGLNSFNPITEEVRTYSETSPAGYTIPSNDISSICEDDFGNIYLGSIKGGLCCINKETGTITQLISSDLNENKLPVKSLLFDSRKRLWIGTDGFGLKQLNFQTKRIESYAPGSTSFDFSKSKVHSIIEDNIGNLWLGIFQKGLYLINNRPEMFNHYGYRAFGENTIGSGCVTAIDGNEKEIWIGTDGDGIYKIDKITKKVEHIILKNEYGIVEGKNLISMHIGSDGFIYIGTYFNGLVKYNEKTGKVKVYKKIPGNPKSLINDKISVIREDKNNQLWLSTLGEGICHFNPETEEFKKGLNLPDSINKLIPKWVNYFFIDKNQNYWIGTYDGLAYYNQQSKKLKLFTEANGLLKNNVIFCIYEDSYGNIWLGTNGGLVKIVPSNMELSYYGIEDGLSSNTICAINEDEFKQLWISTHNGLSRFNTKDERFTNYYASDGLQSNEFSKNATYKSSNNEIFFGGINGLTEIKKDYRNYKRQIRDVMLTDFNLFDKQVKIGDKSGKYTILNKSIVLADTVNLIERDNVFTIGFTSVELANQSRITYEYKMEGFDNDWNVSNSLSRSATYTNLPHGNYTFYVRGIDKDQYSNPRKLTIIIYPPWYKSLLAKTLWLILFAALIYGVILFIRERIRNKEAERINEMKMQFFINISHEIKTPLTLIIDPLDKLLSTKVNEETARLFEIMQRNVNRIFRLVSQLLDVRKIDKGQILMKFQMTNIYDFIIEIAKSYDFQVTSNNIDFKIITEDPEIQVWIDPLNFEKVIFNLLSNAFKFTPAGGKIELSIAKESKLNDHHENQDFLKIIISDTGIGIKKNDIDRIFNRFYQVDSRETRNISGTGIGLHLSRSLVKLHNGEIFAENRTDGQGSRFIVILPMGNSHLPKKDLIIEENIIPTPIHKLHANAIPSMHKSIAEKTGKPKTNYKIMIVEDEDDIRNYLIHELSPYYKVIGCNNGKQAYEIIIDEIPDLIISDIMMPEMDGITLCKKVKGNIVSSHIPVILLTALTKAESKAEAIETGADMYIVKPFNSEFLKKSIAVILENRRKIFEDLNNSAEEYNIENIEIKSHDEILMQKVMTIIKENISDEKLNVEMLADGVGISRVHMHRKLKEITNQSARDFIRNIRMKQAAYLLTHNKVNISEVAYTLGYSNLSHFSNTFKATYGVSPKDYINHQISNAYVSNGEIERTSIGDSKIISKS